MLAVVGTVAGDWRNELVTERRDYVSRLGVTTYGDVDDGVPKDIDVHGDFIELLPIKRNIRYDQGVEFMDKSLVILTEVGIDYGSTVHNSRGDASSQVVISRPKDQSC